MAWLICGTVPEASFPLVEGVWALEGKELSCSRARTLEVSGTEQSLPVLSVQRGTPALLAATVLTCQTLGVEPPVALLVGDTGDGEGSRALYRYLAKRLTSASETNASESGHRSRKQSSLEGMTFHYLFPDVDGHNRVLMALETLQSTGNRPLLVADAGFMYVAKMSGYADVYDLFTPDVGEMAFLADEKAPHPFYTRGFLLAEEDDVPELVRRAYAHGNCARHLLVKGRADYLVRGDAITGTVTEPIVETMEPIGGTGDLVTGLVTGLLAAGMAMLPACERAARTNRIVGQLANPTPATQVAELLGFIPQALRLTS